VRHPKVSIILLNWNGWKDTIECLESLYQITYPNYDVIVVDNGSEDDSIEKIKEYCEGKIEVTSKFFEYDTNNKPIKIIEYTREEAEAGGGKEKEIDDLPSNRKLIFIKNEKNFGFAEGNNIGMRYALKALNPDYILLLNNDTVVDKRFLDELVKVAESDEKIGIVGPKIYYYNHNGQSDVIWFAGGKINYYTGKTPHRGNYERDTGQYNKIEETDYVTGCSLFIKRVIVKEIGMLDEEYFFGHEDIDFCVRASRQGFKIMYAPGSRIWHKYSASLGGQRKSITTVATYYRIRNRFIFLKTYSSRLQFICSTIFFIASLPRYLLSFILYYRNKQLLKYFIKALFSIFRGKGEIK